MSMWLFPSVYSTLLCAPADTSYMWAFADARFASGPLAEDESVGDERLQWPLTSCPLASRLSICTTSRHSGSQTTRRKGRMQKTATSITRLVSTNSLTNGLHNRFTCFSQLQTRAYRDAEKERASCTSRGLASKEVWRWQSALESPLSRTRILVQCWRTQEEVLLARAIKPAKEWWKALPETQVDQSPDTQVQRLLGASPGF